MRWFALLLLVPLSACFTSGQSLYVGQKPLTPLPGGAVIALDPKEPKTRNPGQLELKDGVYRLTDRKSGDVTRFKLYPLAGTPLLVAETADSCKRGDEACEAKPASNYVLVRLTPGQAEWSVPDCSLPLSKLSGIKVKTDSCEFYDRAGLEKALRIVATAPWKAGGIYILR